MFRMLPLLGLDYRPGDGSKSKHNDKTKGIDKMQAIELFTHGKAAITADLQKVLTLRTASGGAATVAIVPATGKGVSVKSLTGLKGQALKAFRRRQQVALKGAMAKEFSGMASSPEWTGRKITVSKSGVVGFFLEPGDGGNVDPKAAAATLSTAELKAMIAAREAAAATAEKK